MSQKTIYGIDFGTSNTVITRWNPIIEKPEIINLKQFSQQLGNNPPLIPSLLYIENAEQKIAFLGQEVRDRGLDLTNNPRFFQNFKRGIGANIQGFLPDLDGKLITFETVGEWFLNSLVEDLKLAEGEIYSLVLTVPVDSFESYRLWLNQVCQNWAVEEVRLLDEPTAVALGYGIQTDGILLVIDFGGGTLDLSLVQLNQETIQNQSQGFLLKWGKTILGNKDNQRLKTAKVFGKVGKNLGGTDLDYWLVNYFAQTQNSPQSSLIKRLSERIKIELSSQEKATEVYFNDETLETYELTLNRSEFNQILQEQQFFEQLDELMTQILQQGRRNGIEKEEIEQVLFVGGSAQIPALQTWIQTYFPPEKVRCDHPFDAIATGALQIAQGVEVKDFLYHSYGIRYWNRRENRHSWHPIIQKGQPYPMSQPIELFLGASVENQPSIELIIGELGAENLSTEVYFDGNRLVTRSLRQGEQTVQPLNDSENSRTLATLNPLGQPGSDRIKVQFQVDAQGFLRVTVEDIFTNETLIANQILSQLQSQ